MTVEMKKYKLGDIGEVRMCKRILKEDTNTVSGIPFFKIGTFGNVADVFITRKKFEEYKAKYSYPKKGDVLISAAGTIGRTVVFNGEEAYFQDSNIVWIENDESKVVNALLYYAYKNVKWKVSNGSTILRLYNDDLRRTEIIVPADIQVQKKIASILSTLDKRIENLRAQNRVLEQTAKTIYDYTFLQCAGHQTTYNKTLNRNIPADWEVKSVGDFAELITKGTTPTTLGFNFEENGVNFVKVECIENGRLITENLTHISKEAHEKLKRSNLHENDILVTIAGRLASPCVVPKSVLPANTNQAVGIIRLTKENQKYVQYVFYCIFDPAMQNKLKGINAQSIQKNLTLPNLGNIPIAVPDDKTLEEFNSQVIPIFRKQQVNSLQIETLTTQRNTLLPLLMTGQIEV